VYIKLVNFANLWNSATPKLAR